MSTKSVARKQHLQKQQAYVIWWQPISLGFNYNKYLHHSVYFSLRFTYALKQMLSKNSSSANVPLQCIMIHKNIRQSEHLLSREVIMELVDDDLIVSNALSDCIQCVTDRRTDRQTDTLHQ